MHKINCTILIVETPSFALQIPSLKILFAFTPVILPPYQLSCKNNKQGRELGNRALRGLVVKFCTNLYVNSSTLCKTNCPVYFQFVCLSHWEHTIKFVRYILMKFLFNCDSMSFSSSLSLEENLSFLWISIPPGDAFQVPWFLSRQWITVISLCNGQFAMYQDIS